MEFTMQLQERLPFFAFQTTLHQQQQLCSVEGPRELCEPKLSGQNGIKHFQVLCLHLPWKGLRIIITTDWN
jgi:hypothetical protein